MPATDALEDAGHPLSPLGPGSQAELGRLVPSLSQLAERECGFEIECNPLLAYDRGYAVADVRAREKRA